MVHAGENCAESQAAAIVTAGHRRESEHDRPLVPVARTREAEQPGSADQDECDEHRVAVHHRSRREDQVSEAGRRRPGSARVAHLREHGRQPGRVEHGDTRGDEPEALQPLAGPEGGGGGQPDAEEERPVVHVDHRGDRRDERGRPRGAATQNSLDVGVRNDEREKRLDLVHARLLRVVREEWVERSERRQDEPGSAIEDRPPGGVRDRDAREPEEQRERVGRALAVAEDPDPETEQQVVAGR